MADSLTPITSNQLSKVTTAKDTDLVTLGINGDFVVMTLANLKEVLGINALNTNTTYPNLGNLATAGHGFTAPANGIAVLCFGVKGNCDCRININNISVARIRWYSGEVSGTNVFPVTVPVGKGQNITISGLTGSVSIENGYFIPYSIG